MKKDPSDPCSLLGLITLTCSCFFLFCLSVTCAQASTGELVPFHGCWANSNTGGVTSVSISMFPSTTQTVVDAFLTISEDEDPTTEANFTEHFYGRLQGEHYTGNFLDVSGTPNGSPLYTSIDLTFYDQTTLAGTLSGANLSDLDVTFSQC